MILSSINLVKTNTPSKIHTNKQCKDGLKDSERVAAKVTKCQELVSTSIFFTCVDGNVLYSNTL